MAYFSNGTEGMSYDSEYCDHCIHMLPEPYGCPVHTAHLLWNYDECNNEKSILHKMIPIKDTQNQQCIFYAKPPGEEPHIKDINYAAPEWTPKR